MLASAKGRSLISAIVLVGIRAAISPDHCSVCCKPLSAPQIRRIRVSPAYCGGEIVPRSQRTALRLCPGVCELRSTPDSAVDIHLSLECLSCQVMVRQ